MADGNDDLDKRLAALKSGGPKANNFNANDLNQRLQGLQEYQKGDVDPNATEDDLWNRLNQLQPHNVVNVQLQPSSKPQGLNAMNSRLPQHQTDALLNQIADEVHLQQANAGNDGFDIDDELDSVEEDPQLYALLKDVEQKHDVEPPKLPSDWAQGLDLKAMGLGLTEQDEQAINQVMDEVPGDILNASKKAADREYKAMRKKEEMALKMQKMGMDPDEILNQIMGDSDDSGSDNVNDDRVNALIQMAQDEVALEDRFGTVEATKEDTKKSVKDQKIKNKKKSDDDDEDEYWDNYADYDTPKKRKKKKRKGWF